MARLSNAQIRARVVASVDQSLALGLDGRRTAPLTRGPNVVRRGRWIVCDTSDPGVLVAVELSPDGIGSGILLGAPAKLRPMVPAALRQAWIAAQYGETDEDP